MISLEQIKTKFLVKKRSFKKGSKTTNPDIFWIFLLVVASLFMIAFSIFGFLLFKQINNEMFFENNLESGRKDTTQQERLNKVLEYFSLRQDKSLNILNSSSPFVDPSL
jgi:flagellar basal body-associated protein FliL